MEKQDVVIVAMCVVGLVLWWTYMGTRQAQPVPRPGPVVDVPARPGDPGEETGAEAPAGPDGGTRSAENGPEVGDGDAFGTGAPPPDAPAMPGNGSQGNAAEPLPEAYRGLEASAPMEFGDDALTLHVDPDRGGVTAVTLHDFKAENREDDIRLGSALAPGFAVSGGEDRPLTFTPARVDDRGTGLLAISRAIRGTGLVVRQRWQLSDTMPGRLAYTLAVENQGGQRQSLSGLILSAGGLGPLHTPKGFFGAAGVDQQIAVREQDDHGCDSYHPGKIAKRKPNHVARLAGTPADWIAVQNKYFTFLMDGKEPVPGVDLRVSDLPAEEGAGKTQLVIGDLLLPDVKLAPGTARSWEFDCYLGPKDYPVLRELGNGKETVMNFDSFMGLRFRWMEYVSLFVLWGLTKLFAVFGNYGVAIIVLTLVFRLSFWPVTHQSTVLSRKMKAIQPMAQEIREKYQDDPQRMWQKTQELYREHKIRPFAAGCLPILLQIPVFFALFNVLRSAVALRQASFVLWITDLSQPDRIGDVLGIPIHPLALVWVGSMFAMQGLMPSSADPQQQKTMKFMTFIFLPLMYPMPSGLILYWTVSNIVSICQYAIARQMDTSTSEVPATA